MKTTIDIPDIPKTLQARVKSKGKREGINVPTVAELYQAWLDDNMSLSSRKPKLSPLSYEEQVRQGKEWFKGWMELVEELRHTPVVDSRSCREILMEDRNRLEQPYPVPAGTVAKPLKSRK